MNVQKTLSFYMISTHNEIHVFKIFIDFEKKIN